MSNIIGTYNLRPAIFGNTWDGMTLSIEVNGTPVNLSGYAIEMRVEKPGTNISSKTMTVGNGITITDAVNGVFTVDAFDINIPKGDYEYKITLTNGSSRIKTRVRGTWKIIEV